jgi:hypothetical protein
MIQLILTYFSAPPRLCASQFFNWFIVEKISSLEELGNVETKKPGDL